MKFAILAVLLVAVLAMPAFAIDWVINPANGHSYAVVHSGSISWSDASLQATSLGGTLACITSAEENQFVLDLVMNDTDMLGQTWLGGFQQDNSTEPSGGWSWVSGEEFSYTNWGAGEPNDTNGLENRIQFACTGNAVTGYWNDMPDNGFSWFPVLTGYIAEVVPVPEPSSLLALGAGIATLTTLKRRKRK